VTALNLDGSVRWTVEADQDLRTVDTAVVAGDLVVGSRSCTDAPLVVTWDLATGEPGPRGAPGDVAVPAYVVDGVGIVSTDVGVTAVDQASDANRWHASGQPIAPPAGGVVLVVGVDSGPVQALDLATGRLRWERGDLGPASVVTDVSHAYFSGADGLTAVSLTDGSTLWTSPLTAGSDRSTVEVGDGIVIGSSADGSSLQGLDAATGDVQWTQPGLLLPQAQTLPFAGDGNVYTSGPDGLGAVDVATGEIRWHVDPASLSADGVTPYGAIPGALLVVTYSSTPEVVALDAASGAVRWRSSARGVGQIVGGEDTVVLLSGCGGGVALPGRAVVVRAGDGKEVWRQDIPAAPSNPVASGGVVVVGGSDACGSGPAHISAHDAATGTELWRRDVSNESPNAPRQQLATAAGVVALLDDGQLVALDRRAGTERWHQPSDAEAGPLATGELFVVANGTQGTLTPPVLTAFRAVDGSTAWTTPMPAPAQVLTLAQGGGRVFVNYYTPEAAFGTLALDGATGAQLWNKPVTAQDAAGDVVLYSDETGVTALDAASGDVRWHQPGTTAVAAGDLVVMFDNQQIPTQPPPNGGSIVVPAELVARNLTDGAERWRVDATFGAAFVAGDLVLVNGPNLENIAYRLVDGSVAWTNRDAGTGPVARDDVTDGIAIAVGGQPTGCGD
jgi:outer membrane protein assembly factor BamB